MSKKLEEKRLRREAEERKETERKRARRNRNLVTLAVAVAVAALVGVLIFNERSAEDAQFSGVAASEAGCTDLERFDLLPADHVDDGTAVDYNSTPPTSGPHYASPANVGFYSSPLQPEQLVHNMEHGQIVIWFRPDAAQDLVDSIEAYVDGAGPTMVATPFEGVPAGSNFTLTAWGASQSCEEVSRAVIDDFRSEFQGRGPEQLTPPFNPDA